MVKVNYDSEYPPEIYLVEGTCEPVLLDANTVGQIDLSYIKNVDVELGQYENQKTGKKSYGLIGRMLKSMREGSVQT